DANVTGACIFAASVGSSASAAFDDGSTTWIKGFAVLLVLAMTLLNIVGSQAVARTQTVIVYVVLTILTLFASRPWPTSTLICLRSPAIPRSATSCRASP